jgi:hypothetical protein
MPHASRSSWAWWRATTLACMQDLLTRAYRYRKVAVDFSNLAKYTSSDFSRGYYQRIAEQYQMLAGGELGWRQSDAKVWAYRGQSGNKYFEVFLNDGTRARIDKIKVVEPALQKETGRPFFDGVGPRLDVSSKRCAYAPSHRSAQ